MDEEKITKKEMKNNTFNVILGISTLLIAILGITFAYFSATARSDEGEVSVKSAYVSISYDGGTEIKAKNLIPSTKAVALSKFQKEVTSIGTIAADGKNDQELEFIEKNDEEAEYNADDLDRRCIDANGREVCYVYSFSITSDGEENKETEINGYVKVESNEFSNLSYILYEVDYDKEGDRYKVDKYGNKIPINYKINDSATLESFIRTGKETTEDGNSPFRAIFEKPVDKKDENEDITGTTKPLACLFGYADGYEQLDIDNPERCRKYKITNGVKHEYQLMIWLNETGNEQREQSLEFAGTVSVEVTGGESGDEKITGTE